MVWGKDAPETGTRAAPETGTRAGFPPLLRGRPLTSRTPVSGPPHGWQAGGWRNPVSVLVSILLTAMALTVLLSCLPLLAPEAASAAFAPEDRQVIRASTLAFLSMERFLRQETEALQTFVPLYGRKSDAQRNRGRRHGVRFGLTD